MHAKAIRKGIEINQSNGNTGNASNAIGQQIASRTSQQTAKIRIFICLEPVAEPYGGGDRSCSFNTSVGRKVSSQIIAGHPVLPMHR